MERTYLPVLLLLGFVVMNAVLIILISHLTLRPRPTEVKQTPYESGIPVLGDKGASVHVRSFVTALARQGHEVVVACAQLGSGNPPPPVWLIELPPPQGDDALRG